MLVILRFPHLVLANVGHDDGVGVAGLAPDVVDDVSGVKMSVVRQVLNIADRGVSLETIDRIQPLAAIGRLDSRQQFMQHLAQIADQCDVDFHVLVNLRWIDLDVNLLRVGRVVFQIAGHAIVKAHAERDQQVGVLDRMVHPRFAVHTHHPEIQRVRSRECAQSKQRQCDGNARPLGEVADFVHRSGNDDAVPGQDHWPLRIVDQFQRFVIFLRIGRQVGTVSGQLWFRRLPVERAGRLLRIFRDIHQHRPRSPGPRNIESLANRARHFAGMRYQIIVLGDGERDTGDVSFLKRVGSNQLAADLSGDADDGRRVQHGRRNARDHVGRARPGRGHRHAHSASGAGEPVGHMSRALLVTYQDVVNLAVLQRVVGGQNCAARIPEHRLHALAFEAFPQNACPAHDCRFLLVLHTTLLP